jgi:hypothetical protein
MTLTIPDAGPRRAMISTIILVKDNGKPHVVALWGGTLFN